MQTVTDNPVAAADPKAIGARLREVREAAGLSRAALAKRIGADRLSPRAIEKIESGVQEPSISRLLMLCETLGTPLVKLTGADPALLVDELDEPVPVAPQPELPIQLPTEVPSHETGPRDLLAMLDEQREAGFEGTRRRALAVIDELKRGLTALEPDELIDLADERSLHRGDCPSGFELLELFAESFDKAQELCGSVEERIIDTAILGDDLYAIERNGLVDLADQLRKSHGIEPPDDADFFTVWGNHEQLVPVLRPVVRSLAVAGNGIDFEDRERFPRRRRF